MPRETSNPPNPWMRQRIEWTEGAPPAELELMLERARSVVSDNDSPDLPFRFSVNPYRGCQHACAYCYARPTHQYLGLGAGTDFDRRIVVKENAPECLRRELAGRRLRGEMLVFSGVTDCYQPVEARFELTRRCLEVCREFRQPVAVITKGSLVRRDAELLAELGARGGSAAFVSIPFADEPTGRAIEPGASTPAHRFETIGVLARAGVDTGVAIAPLVPGLNDAHVAEILERAAAAGATRAFLMPLRLTAETAAVFLERVREALPGRAAKVEHAVAEMRGGKLTESRFGARMRGSGPRWELVRKMFEVQCRRLGLRTGRAEVGESSARASPTQRTLFES